MILKRLGIGKKSEYFLEAPPLSHDESQANAKINPQPQPAKSEPTAAVITPADVKAAQIAESPTAAEPTAQPATSKKKSKQTKSAGNEPRTAPKIEASKPEPATVNFATEYLIPKNTPRRRPGPSLDMFKDMAKQVNSQK